MTEQTSHTDVKRISIRPGWILLGLSLITAFVIVLIVGFSIYTTKAAERIIQSYGGKFYYEPRRPDWWGKSLNALHIPAANIVVAVDLGGCDIGDDEFSRIADALEMFDQLRELNLPDLKISARSLAELKRLSSLQFLNLANNSLTEKGVKHLQALKNIKALGLAGTTINDEGLSELSVLSHLRYLNLDNTNVSDAGIKHLGSLPNLETLSLSNTSVTEEGLMRLEEMTGAINVSDD